MPSANGCFTLQASNPDLQVCDVSDEEPVISNPEREDGDELVDLTDARKRVRPRADESSDEEDIFAPMSSKLERKPILSKKGKLGCLLEDVRGTKRDEATVEHAKSTEICADVDCSESQDAECRRDQEEETEFLAHVVASAAKAPADGESTGSKVDCASAEGGDKCAPALATSDFESSNRTTPESRPNSAAVKPETSFEPTAQDDCVSRSTPLPANKQSHLPSGSIPAGARPPPPDDWLLAQSWSRRGIDGEKGQAHAAAAQGIGSQQKSAITIPSFNLGGSSDSE